LLSCGYLLFLASLARRSPGAPALAAADWPAVAVVVPTQNEATYIAAKLRDLADIDVPGAPPQLLVVDGGSQDGTLAIVEAAMADLPLRLASVPGARSKAEQINHALGLLDAEFVVVTDVDTRLEPGCVRALVAMLVAQPDTAVVAAVVRPESRLAEERLHWQVVNLLWWLEGLALSAVGLSGVCYAVRRSAIRAIEADARAEDVQLALAAGARGLRVRVCPEAIATELRVPQTSAQLLSYRRRRGRAFVNELRRELPAEAPGLFRVFRRFRLLQFDTVPALALATLALGAVLALTPDRAWLVPVAALFAVPLAWASRGIPGTPVPAPSLWTLPVAACRLAGLVWISLIAAPRPRPVEEKVRCSEPVI
jgi:cellulose synthase/poly-beta-1,6-N-acetylglucosamine synthase-like glycosyltransferase